MRIIHMYKIYAFSIFNASDTTFLLNDGLSDMRVIKLIFLINEKT